MALQIGTRLGPYEIQSAIGAGGMGEVYRAADTNLKRAVAIKVLPDAFASEADRLARFRREAEILASLNHPNIAQIHGLEERDGIKALVMELVEGPTLADRIAQGAIPLDEALPIAKQIAEAVEAAHDQGIIHRDLKPANIKLRPDGVVKVLDFGLAKALEPASARSADASASPTITSPAIMTGVGMLLGTAAYMSPEQAKGRPADKRSDVWAFGCVLYEMITGRRVFEGDEVTEMLAGILRGEPEWDALPRSTPRSIRRLLRRCLEKNWRDRLQAIGDARLEIADALTSRTDDGPPAAPVSPASRATYIVPVVVASAVAALVAAIAAWTLKPAPPVLQPRVTRSLLAVEPFDQLPPATPADTRPRVGRPNRTAIALSPDGRTVVFRGVQRTQAGGVQPQLFIRSLDSLDVTPIAGTTGADNPFFSPDGAWIGLWDNGELRRVPATGGPTTAIARVPGVGVSRIIGASWGDGDVIVFATFDGLWRVAASGGVPASVTKSGEADFAHKLPHLLPGGQVVLFTRQKTDFRWDDAQTVARSLVTGEEKVVLDDAADARYVPSGHLVFVRRGTLMAVPFDPSRLATTGGQVALIDGVIQAANMGNSDSDSGAGQFAVAAQGRLIYVTGGIDRDEERDLVWVDRDGHVEPIPAPRREYTAPRLSPDGQRIVVFTQPSAGGGGLRVWIYDIPRRTLRPWTGQEERSLWGIWSPDGTRIALLNLLAGRSVLSWKRADGTGGTEQFSSSGVPNSWSRDGKIAFVDGSSVTGADIWVGDVNVADRPAQPLVQTPAAERYPIFSPDGKWLAYTSNESGREEVYVQPYPGPGPRVLVSTNGGMAPTWRGDGAELFYSVFSNSDNIVMNAVPVSASASGFSPGMPRKLFAGRYINSGPARGYDVAPDGRRFLMTQPVDPPPPPRTDLVLVENWLEDLKRLVPTN